MSIIHLIPGLWIEVKKEPQNWRPDLLPLISNLSSQVAVQKLEFIENAASPINLGPLIVFNYHSSDCLVHWPGSKGSNCKNTTHGTPGASPQCLSTRVPIAVTLQGRQTHHTPFGDDEIWSCYSCVHSVFNYSFESHVPNNFCIV